MITSTHEYHNKQEKKTMSTSPTIQGSLGEETADGRQKKRMKTKPVLSRSERDQLLDFECFTSQSITESILVEFLQDIMKQQTSLSAMDLSSLGDNYIRGQDNDN